MGPPSSSAAAPFQSSIRRTDKNWRPRGAPGFPAGDFGAETGNRACPGPETAGHLKKRLLKGVLPCKDSCNTIQRLIALQSEPK